MEPLFLFKIEDLTYYYPDTDQPALKNINLGVKEGEFLLVVGGSGSGKSSLARVLAGLIPDFYGGKCGGKVLFKGVDLHKIDRRTLAREVGIVFQDPEKQLVMTSVEAEIVFGLENMGLQQEEMLRRLAEVMSFLNLTPIRNEFTANLSGGQKQKVAIASVLAMQPKVLLLDEPTSQLDPLAAEEILNLVKRLNEEMGYTIILIEQRLERCFHLADRLLVMEQGQILKDGPPPEVACWEVENYLPFVPPVARFFALCGAPSVPLSVKEGRMVLKKYFPVSSLVPSTWERQKPWKYPRLFRRKNAQRVPENNKAVEIKNLWYTYPDGKEALRGIDCTLKKGEFVAILGENAAGKSTLLKQMVGLLKPGRGSVTVMGKDTGKFSVSRLVREIGYLSQNPNDYLFCDTVEEELQFTLYNLKLKNDGVINFVLNKLGIYGLRQINPRDLSAGERQRVALASVLVARPGILVLDEPTRGIDCRLKNDLGGLLSELVSDGTTVIVVTHDVEFATEYAQRAVMMFNGKIVSDGPKHEVLGSSMFYSPQMTRLFRGFSDGVLTIKEAIEKTKLVSIQ